MRLGTSPGWSGCERATPGWGAGGEAESQRVSCRVWRFITQAEAAWGEQGKGPGPGTDAGGAGSRAHPAPWLVTITFHPRRDPEAATCRPGHRSSPRPRQGGGRPRGNGGAGFHPQVTRSRDDSVHTGRERRKRQEQNGENEEMRETESGRRSATWWQIAPPALSPPQRRPGPFTIQA